MNEGMEAKTGVGWEYFSLLALLACQFIVLNAIDGADLVTHVNTW